MSDKVVLAYSGGLDTSVAIKWLEEKYGMDVIAFTVDVGGDRDLDFTQKKAAGVGAIKAVVADAKEELVREYIFPALQAGAVYQGTYSLATALSRPLMAKLQVEVALREGAAAIAHGCTGKGNDQVRFEVAAAALAPQLKVIAPAREWGMSREETIAYAKKHEIPIPITSASPYSIDENLWGRSIECGVLEDPWVEPPDDVFQWTNSPERAPDQPGYIELGFEQGLPVSVNGEVLTGLDLVNQVNEIAGRHGVGRVDHIEDRLVGIKSREIYEAPAATVMLAAHQALEAMTLSRGQLRFKRMVADEYAGLIYDGLWFSSHRNDLAAYVKSTQEYVTGSVRLKLHKGGFQIVGRKSPYSLYRHDLATYEKGDLFDQSAAPGFIQLWGLSTKVQSRIQTRNSA